MSSKTFIFFILFVVRLDKSFGEAFGETHGNAKPIHSGTLTAVNGLVEIFSNPSDVANGQPPFIRFEGKTYTIKAAKVGAKLLLEEVIRTGLDGKAKLVFSNGDTISIGPGTSYRIDSDAKNDKKPPSLNIIYGKIRALISSQGPRSGMRVNTPTAVAGVRGTDFYVGVAPSNQATQVSVLRGQVAVASKRPETSPPPPSSSLAKSGAANVLPPVTKDEPKFVIVKSGFIVDVVPKKESRPPSAGAIAAAPADVEILPVRQATKSELVQIQAATAVKQEQKVEDAKIQAELNQLEAQATKTTLEDIQKHDPIMFAKIKEKGIAKLDEIQSEVITEVVKQAPKGPSKPIFDKEDLTEDVYKKYFNPEK